MRPGPRLRSLRFYLVVGVGVLLVLLLTTFVITYRELLAATDRRGADRARHLELLEATEELMTALVDQEAGLRAYLVNGDRRFLEPYELGHAATFSSLRAITAALTIADRQALAGELTALEGAIDTWRTTVAGPQVASRGAGPIADLDAALRAGKAAFDDIRATRATFKRALKGRLDTGLVGHQRDIRRINLLAASAVALTALFGLLLIRFLVRQVAQPLADLATVAASGERFPAPAGTPVRELATLARALHELDAAVYDREQLLTAAHGDAVALSKFGEHVQQLTDEHELHGVLARTFTDQLEAARTHVMVRNASHDRLEVEWPAMRIEDQLEHPILSAPLKCRAVRTLRTVSTDAGSAIACQCALGVPTEGSYMCVPMLAAGELVGVVNLQARTPGHFTPARQQHAQGYVSFASTTLSSMRLLAATRERALRDPLTGAYNRGFLDEYLAKQLSQARRRNRSLAILLLDLDHFKRLNDTHGHQAGDAALVGLARCLQQQTRGADAVIRYGGEEFVILLVDTDLATAVTVAERIRAAVETVVVTTATGALGTILRCSIGVASVPEHGSDERTLFAAADGALYRAKAAGRNQVKVADLRAIAVAGAAAPATPPPTADSPVIAHGERRTPPTS